MSDALRQAEIMHDLLLLEGLIPELELDAQEDPADTATATRLHEAHQRRDAMTRELEALTGEPPRPTLPAAPMARELEALASDAPPRPTLPAAPMATLGLAPDSSIAANLSRGLSRPAHHLASSRPLSRALGPTVTPAAPSPVALEDLDGDGD